MVAVYVDDLVIISGSSHALVSDFKQSLASKYDLTDQGELTQILGIKVVRDKRSKCFFYLSQTSFIKDALVKFGLDYLPACKTPIDHTVDLTPTPGFEAELSDANLYRSMVGTLAWVANWTRPELAFAVHKLQRTQNNPEEPKHFEAVQRAFRYLKGTQSESLRLGGDLILRAYSDSDFCTDRIDGKSVTGY
ncbi:unnamed protein product, partial [Heterosigma akashiwo]